MRQTQHWDGALLRPFQQTQTFDIESPTIFVTQFRSIMKSNRIFSALALSAAFMLTTFTPAFAVNRDIVQLQTQVDQLQQAMTQMKQSFDERMGVMKSMMEQNSVIAN